MSNGTVVAAEEPVENVPQAPDAAADYVRQLREKILFGLSVYHFLSPSMLHVFLGTATPASLWKDKILTELLEEGLVVKEDVQLTSPFERSQTYTILRLPDNKYKAPKALEARG